MIGSQDEVQIEQLQIERDEIDERVRLDRIEWVDVRLAFEQRGREVSRRHGAHEHARKLRHRIPLPELQLAGSRAEIESQTFGERLAADVLRAPATPAPARE